MTQVLITGALGHLGRTLAEALVADGHEVVGADLAVDASPAGAPVRLASVDVRDESQISAVLADVRPDVIFHLAAIVPIRQAIENPAPTLETNVIGTANLLQAVRKSGLDPRIVMPGSSEEYGLIRPEETPVTEDQPLRPSNPYAVSKVAQTLLGMQFFRSHGVRVIVGRTFNMTGPGQSTEYACPAFARQVARIDAGLCEPVVRVGNLSPRRDYNDHRDVVRALMQLAERGRPGETYNICTGRAISMREILEKLLALASVPVRVEVDPARCRPAENELIVGDNSKLFRATGHTPEYDMDRTLRDVLDYWRERVDEQDVRSPQAK